MNRLRKIQVMAYIVLCTALAVFCGCVSTEYGNRTGLAMPEGISARPGINPRFAAPGPAEGSLWMGKNASLFEDSRAAHVGDTIIVDIIENSTSAMNVNTESSRKTGMDIGLPTINLLGDKKIFGAGPGETKLLGTDFSNTFKGEGKNTRSGQVTASIAARVTEVLPNGNLSIFGRRAVKVDNEVQYITVAGVVRPQDISSSNRVKSSNLADSRIEYYGKGALADKQKPGWGTRIIDNIWPW
jgi:flagellar L-ring protein precursor FlgH